MDTGQVGLRDVRRGARQSRARLLAPVRYLLIFHPEKTLYDFILPASIAVLCWIVYTLIEPKPEIFGENGLLRFVRDLLIMGVPFMIGALAAVAMGSPGQHLDRRPVGVELILDGKSLSLRSFVCYLLGYLSFLGLVVLGLAVLADLMRPAMMSWTSGLPGIREIVHGFGMFVLLALLSSLIVTTFWALYFLTDAVNN